MPLILKLAAAFSLASVALVLICPVAMLAWGERPGARCLLAALACSVSGLSLLVLYALCGPSIVNGGFEMRMRLRNPQASAGSAGVIRRNPQKSAEYDLRPDKRSLFSADATRRVRLVWAEGRPLKQR